MLTDDDPMRQRSLNRGNSRNAPRPPTMIEQKFAHAPTSFANIPPPHAMPDMYNDSNGYFPGAYGQPSFTPGQIVSMAPQSPMSPPPAAVNPFYAHPSYGGVDGSPFDDAHAQVLTRQPSTGAAQVLTRQPSAGANAYLARQPSLGAGQALPPQAHYVDLSRSSVTPFQAAQYAEISRRLNTAPPGPLPTPAIVEEEVPPMPEDAMHRGSANVRPLDLGQAVNPHQLISDHGHALPESPFADPHVQHEVAHGTEEEDEEALPEPPQRSLSARARVPSIPPTLPEIAQRPFSPVSYEFPSTLSTAKPTLAPSPLSSTADMPSPPPAAYAAPLSAGPRETGGAPGKRPDTVYTIYDDEDAYGGI